MPRTFILLLLAAATVATPPVLGDDKKASKEKLSVDDLLGAYTVVSGEKEGKKEPEERVQGTMVRFAEDGVVVTDKDRKEVYAATFKLDDSQSPCKITMTSRLPSVGEVAKGLIEKDGQTIKLIYALPGGDAPTEFKTKEKQLMFVMKFKNK